MADAAYDHRSSMDGEPRTIYGKIVSSADRNTSIESPLRRTYAYRKEHSPDSTLDEIIEESRRHLLDKFVVNGQSYEGEVTLNQKDCLASKNVYYAPDSPNLNTIRTDMLSSPYTNIVIVLCAGVWLCSFLLLPSRPTKNLIELVEEEKRENFAVTIIITANLLFLSALVALNNEVLLNIFFLVIIISQACLAILMVIVTLLAYKNECKLLAYEDELKQVEKHQGIVYFGDTYLLKDCIFSLNLSMPKVYTRILYKDIANVTKKRIRSEGEYFYQVTANLVDGRKKKLGVLNAIAVEETNGQPCTGEWRQFFDKLHKKGVVIQ